MFFVLILIGLIMTYLEDPKKVGPHYKSLYSFSLHSLPKLLNPFVIVHLLAQLFFLRKLICTEDMKAFIDEKCFYYKQKK